MNAARLTSWALVSAFYSSFFLGWLLPSAGFFQSANGDMFARFGSVLVAITIAWIAWNNHLLFKLSGIRPKWEKFEEALGEFSKADLASLVKNKEIFLAESSGEELVRRRAIISQIEDYFLNEKMPPIQAIDWFATFSQRLEICGLIIGTLQWGFGDLVVNRLMICGEWKC